MILCGNLVKRRGDEKNNYTCEHDFDSISVSLGLWLCSTGTSTSTGTSAGTSTQAGTGTSPGT